MQNKSVDRRTFLGGVVSSMAVAPALLAAQPSRQPAGLASGQTEGATAAEEMMAAGGNAVDAAVTAALVAGVVAVGGCGPGGYGGHMMIATPDGRRVRAIDFNTAAPQSATPNMFPLGPNGRVKGGVNSTGWLAAGVPGTLAGLQLALDRFGTRTFRQVVQPALGLARDGITVSPSFALAVRNARAALTRDPGAARLLLPGGKPLAAGDRYRNPDLAAMFEELGQANSVEPFYRGRIAQRIAEAFARNGGRVTAGDLAAYRAREVEPLTMSWRGCSIRTATLTAGGLTVLQALTTLRALDWQDRDPAEPSTTHLRVEALRVAWDDRLQLLGDRPDVPVRRLLSEEYARETARRVEKAVRAGQRLPTTNNGPLWGGTIHLSVVDAAGMMVALTLTHGESFGAKIAVDGLGLILGHGMSRFDPRPEHPNAPGPGKRPLHNMCPTIILKDDRPLMALGAHGGRRIPNAVFDVVTAAVARQQPLREAIAAPRLHTEGGLPMLMERTWPEAHVAYMRRIGYQVQLAGSAFVSAVTRDSRTGELGKASR